MTTLLQTGVANTATVDQSVLETSNGGGGGMWQPYGSTSFGSSNAAEREVVSRWSVVGCSVLAIGMSAAMLR